MGQNKGGQPTIAPWEKVRIVAWTSWVRMRTQKKLDDAMAGALPDGDPFRAVVLSFRTRWTIKHSKPLSMSDLGAVYLGSRSGDQTRTDFSAYQKGANARPKSAVIDAVDQALPGTGNFYRYGPYAVPLWMALAGRLTVDDFWHPLACSKVFDALKWKESRNLIEQGGVADDLMAVLLNTPWQVWLATIAKLCEHNDDVGEDGDGKAKGHRRYGYAAMAIAATHLAIRDDKYSDPQKKLELVALLKEFAELWAPLDANFTGSTPNPYPLAAAVETLADELRGIAEEAIRIESEPCPDETDSTTI